MKKGTPETMLVNDTVFEILLKDYDLRKKLSDKMNIRESAVKGWAYRKQHFRVGFNTVAEIIKEHTGLTDKDFFKVIINELVI